MARTPGRWVNFQRPLLGHYSTTDDTAQHAHVKELWEGLDPAVPLASQQPLLKTRFAYNKSTLNQNPGIMTTRVTNGENETTTYRIGKEGESLSVTIDALNQTTSTGWDLTKYVKTREVDALGRETTYSYNSDGDETDVTIAKASSPYPLTDGDGAPISTITTHREYDPTWHRVRLEASSDGTTIEYTIDSNFGTVTAKSETGDSASRNETYTYDNKGNRLTETSFEDETTTYSQYDVLGNAHRIDFPLNTHLLIDYDSRGRKRSETSSQGRQEMWEYNELDQLIEHTITDTRGATDFFRETWRYSTEGLVLEHADSTGLVESFTYDLLGRKSAYTIKTGRILGSGQPETYTTSWTYDAAGRIQMRTDPDNSVHAFIYDEAGRLLSETIDSKPLFIQELDPAGNVRFRTDHRGARTEHQYDALYRKIKEISPQVNCANPDGSRTLCSPEKTWLYDRAGRMTREIDANGNERTLVYDAFKRVGEERLPLGHMITRTYDKMDRLKTELKQPEGLLIGKNYDELGRVVQETRTLQEQDATYTTTYQFDDENQTVTVTNAAGETQLVTYGGLGHVKSVTLDPNGLNLTYSTLYDGHGKARAETDANGNITTWRNDGLGRRYEGTGPLLQIDDESGATSRRATVSRQYDFAGRLLVEIDPRGAEVIRTYDPLGRELTRVFQFEGGSEVLATWQYHDDVSLDPPQPGGPDDPSITETDGRGNTILHWNDAMGREVLTVDQEGHVSQVFYDRNSNLASKIDRRGFEQRVRYDALNRKLENRWVGGASGAGSDFVETMTYDDQARQVATVDRMGFLHIQINDEAGRKVEERIEERDQAGNLINEITMGRWSYDGLDRVTDAFDGNGNKTHYEFDNVGRNVARTIADGTQDANTITFSFDKMDHVKTISDCEGLLVTNEYDAGYRLLSETDANGNTTHYGSDLVGNRSSMTNGEGNKTVYGHDGRRRLVRVKDPSENVTQYGYDGNNNRTLMLNGENHRTEWQYDRVNRVTHQKRFIGTLPRQVNQTVYDAEGNRVGMIDATGQNFSYEIDALGRETAAIYPFDESGPDQTLLKIERTYDDLDRPTLVTQIRKSGAGQSTEQRFMTWDFAGRQTSETDAHGVAQPYTYDDNGNRLSSEIDIPQQSSRTIGYTYDHRNRMKTVNEGGTTAYNYRCRGEKIDSVLRSDGSTETYGYDNADRLTSKTVKNESGNTVLSYTYEYDRADRRLSQIENHGQGPEETSYAYYGNAALQRVTYHDGMQVEYVYDRAGNRIQESVIVGGDTVSDKTYSYNELDELTGISDSITGDVSSFEYDANGNQTRKTETTGGVSKVTELEYTSRNHVQKVSVDSSQVVLFAYDDAGRRIQKNAELEHWDGHALVAETDASSGVLLRDYTHGLDLLRETVTGISVQVYTDVLGSVGLLRNSTLEGRYRYDAFGTIRNPADCTASPNQLACQNNLTFTGHLFDREFDLYYFNARYYNSNTGRFTATDPAVDLSKYRDYFDSGIAGTVFAGAQSMPSMVVAQHATDWSVVKTENGLEPAFASIHMTQNPNAASDPFLAAANSADWSLSTAKDNAVPQLTFDLRPQYATSESTGYPPVDPMVPYAWYQYAYAFNSPANYTDPLGTDVQILQGLDPTQMTREEYFKAASKQVGPQDALVFTDLVYTDASSLSKGSALATGVSTHAKEFAEFALKAEIVTAVSAVTFGAGTAAMGTGWGAVLASGGVSGLAGQGTSDVLNGQVSSWQSYAFSTGIGLLGGSIAKGAGVFEQTPAVLNLSGPRPTGDYFSIAYEMKLDTLDVPTSRAVHANRANNALRSAMASDPVFAQSIQDLGINTVPAGSAPPQGWTWHHGDEFGSMLLVPRSQHTPGSIFWRAFHPTRSGGYSQWAIPAGAKPNR